MPNEVFRYPTSTPLFSAMWAQISGLADCCGGGVIGRISGLKLDTTKLYEQSLGINTTPHKAFTSMQDYIMTVLPSNKLFAGPAKYLYWAILQDICNKAQTGRHTSQILAKSVPISTFDFENNSYHNFWAGNTFKVHLWALSDRSSGRYMSNPTTLRVSTFLNYVEENDLCTVWRTGDVPGSYGPQKIQGAFLTPNIAAIQKGLPAVISEANKMCEARWKEIEPYIKNVKPITDKVAQKW